MVRRVIAPLLLAAIFAAILIQLPAAIAARASDYEWFDPIVVVRGLILENFVEEISEEQRKNMRTSMIRTMVDELNDPYTEYVPPRDLASFDKSLRGEYVGIGAEVNVENGYLVIVTPMEDSPALEAGIMAGDVVLEINGETTYQQPIQDSIERLTGEPDTSVTVKVRHRNGEEEVLTITRRKIVAQTIKGAYRDGETWEFLIDQEQRIGYVRVTQFTATTIEGMRDALDTLEEAGVAGLIIDVRFDPGGELQGAVALADMFLDEGKIVTIRGRAREEVIFSAQPGDTFRDVPIVILVNEGSASASEILSGALQDNGRAKVLGERTFGKGSVQEVRPLPDGMGTLKMTTAYYYLPSGRNLHRKEGEAIWGVDPDPGFYVEMSNDAYQTMLRTRREYEAINEGADAQNDARWHDPVWIREVLKDHQLAAALAAMQGYLADGAWPTIGGESATEEVLTAEIRENIELRNRLAEQLMAIDRQISILRGLATDAGAETILPENVELGGGTLTVKDKSGETIATFRIQSDEDLRRALQYARLERME